jgi:hypothetical protein
MTLRQAESISLARPAGARTISAASLLCTAWLAAFPAHAAPEPVRRAVFDFELEDYSAGARPDQAPADTARLAEVSAEIRRLLAQSGRYTVVDPGGADAPQAKMHALNACNGCEAAVAGKLGAEQSFFGVVGRISRMEYVVRFQIRDARTGAVVSAASSDLYMGADYAWSRGAARLVKDRLLETQDTR